jgi:hypothetical protein
MDDLLDDPFWRNRNCLNFVRSQSAPEVDCNGGPTEQVSDTFKTRRHSYKFLKTLKDNISFKILDGALPQFRLK